MTGELAGGIGLVAQASLDKAAISAAESLTAKKHRKKAEAYA